jgi:hypothetical protein
MDTCLATANWSNVTDTLIVDAVGLAIIILVTTACVEVGTVYMEGASPNAPCVIAVDASV